MALGVIVPVHGPAPYLRETLCSVLAQDPAPDEVVVVDDGSPEPVALAGETASRCRVIRRAVRGGPAAARQTGLAELAADLVALADADDVWRPGKLDVQLAALARDPEAALCFGRAEVIGAEGAATGERWPAPAPGSLDPGALPRWLYERNDIPTSSVVAHRGPLEAAGGFAGPAALPGDWDWDLWLRLVTRGERFVYEPRAAIAYRRHQAGLTADVAALAELALAVHDAHAGLVEPDTHRRARAGDLRALARGRVRQRRYGDAGRALAEAAALTPPGTRDRALRALVAVPGARAGLGRRAPYRRRL